MLKVIIADDEERVCRMLQILPDWTALEMEVAATAANGIEALQAIERDPPDILITDIRMPGCDGLELIARAKQLAPEIEIIIISGYAHFEYAQ
ncbi:MAG: response regulator, partial [Clostridia bacterium]